MTLRVNAVLVLLTGMCLAAVVSVQARPVSLFAAASSDFIYEDLDTRDAHNRPVTDAKSVMMLRETFAVSLYQILMVRGLPAAALVGGLVGKNLPDCSSFGGPLSKFITGVKSLAAILAERFGKTLPQNAAAFLSIVTFGGFFIISVRRPPVPVRTFEVLRC